MRGLEEEGEGFIVVEGEVDEEGGSGSVVGSSIDYSFEAYSEVSSGIGRCAGACSRTDSEGEVCVQQDVGCIGDSLVAYAGTEVNPKI